MHSEILTTIAQLTDLMYIGSMPREEILEAERCLGLSFADDYRTYVLEYGAISAKGIELTGVFHNPAVGVVEVTLRERERNQLSGDMYVIEDYAVDGAIAVQNTAGEIFVLSPHHKIKKICDSLTEYVAEKVNKE